MAEMGDPTIIATGNGQTPSNDASAAEVAEALVDVIKIKNLLAEVQAKYGEITSAAAQVLAIRTKVEDHQTVVATKSGHIEDAQKHGDKVRAELDRELTTAKQQTVEAEAQKTRAHTAADESVKTLADIQAAKGTAKTDAEEVAAALKAAQESAAKTKDLADKSDVVTVRINQYETRLKELEAEGKDRLRTIETLLPGAASTGLAYGFAERRDAFVTPRSKWELIYISSLVGITVIAIINWFSFHEPTHTWDQTLLLWLVRLPMVAPLILLAYHAAHKQAIAERLEEAYGNKVAACSSFMGFSKQLSEANNQIASDALAKLYDNTLATIADPPGKIYEKHALVVTPADLVTQVAKSVKEIIEPLLPGKPS